jgi:exopolysaccharide biosynthesis polyprenyl glycosylphosphotransferase
MLKRHHQLVLSLLVIADALAVSAAWLASYYLRFQYLPVDPNKGVPALWDRFLPIMPLVVLGHLIIFNRLHLYRPRRSEGIWRETRDIFKAFVVAIVVVVVIDYALPETNKISRRFIATYAVVGSVLFTLFRLSVRGFARALRKRGFNRRWTLIVGTGRTAQRLAQALRGNSWTGFEVAYFADDRENPGTLLGVPVRGPLSQLATLVEQHPVDSIFVALPSTQTQRTDEVLAALTLSMADVRLVPDMNPLYAMRPDVTQLDGVPILSLRQTPLYGSDALTKRIFDVVVGSICLLIGGLPMAAIALLVKLSSRGPVLYRQRRMGLDGQEFTLLKFRTMRADAEAHGPVWSQTADARRTRIGAFLRRTSLDELPNLFNVLGGSMSLVGPRPEEPEVVEHYTPEMRRRLDVKPGLTGLAQISGRGELPLREVIAKDIEYVDRRSFWLDLNILIRTPFTVFSRRGAL